MLKVLLAGLGVRGKYWADVINRSEHSKTVAFADPNSEALKCANKQFGEHQTFASTEDALVALDEIDALVLANPPIGRESQIQAAIGRNIPMLIEKPLALDLDEAAHFVKLAETANVSLMVGLNFRYLDVTKAAQKLLAEETVGKAEFARFTYERWRDGTRPDLNKYPLMMEHPMLWEQSIHHFDLLRHVYQSEPIRVQCHTWNPSWSMYDHDTNVAAIIEFENGLSVNYQGTWQGNWQVPSFEWRTDCTEGIVTQRDQFGELFYAHRDDESLTKVNLPPHERWVSDTMGLWDAFLAHVMDGNKLECSGHDHLISLAMLEACIQSSSHNKVVNMRDILST